MIFISTDNGIKWIIDRLKKDQSPDGSWSYPFETGITTDAYMIILLRTLEINDEHLIRGLASRIMSKQEKNGTWKLFHDESDRNVSSVIEAYYALLYSGYFSKNDPRLAASRQFIKENGGLEAANMFTKIMLALTGQYKWPEYSPIPIEVILLPLSFPINFYQFSVFGRSNLAPIIVLAEKKHSIKTNRSPDLSDLNVRAADEWELYSDWRSLISTLKEGIESLMGTPEEIHSLALNRAQNYIANHIEPDGTLYSYFSSTFLMIFAYLSLGMSKQSPLITKAVNGLLSMKTEIDGFPHMQYTTANVWNTSLISYALQEARVAIHDPIIKKANYYLLEHQHKKFGDWVIHNPNSLPGGWGFSDVNTMNPDVDDTSASLRAIARDVLLGEPLKQKAWDQGMNWLLSMQNLDGGWASFEKNLRNDWLEWVPIEKAEFLLGDSSTADLTGRTLEFFGRYTGLSIENSIIKKAVEWLIKNQEEDGSWYGRWGICYLYGTWAAVTGLIAVGVSNRHPSIQRAVKWLTAVQQADGGFGESCLSDSQKKFVPLQKSTLTHTSWALDSLIAVSDKPTPEIQKGMDFLLNSIDKRDWTTDYPKGQGMAGAFYIHYHSYRYIFPLLTLSHYKRKFQQ